MQFNKSIDFFAVLNEDFSAPITGRESLPFFPTYEEAEVYKKTLTNYGHVDLRIEKFEVEVDD